MVAKFHQINRNLEEGNEVLTQWIDKEEDKLGKKHGRYDIERKTQLTVRKETDKINFGLKEEVSEAIDSKEAKKKLLGKFNSVCYKFFASYSRIAKEGN
jgi:hypothetical protein